MTTELENGHSEFFFLLWKLYAFLVKRVVPEWKPMTGSEKKPELYLYNSLTRHKELFKPVTGHQVWEVNHKYSVREDNGTGGWVDNCYDVFCLPEWMDEIFLKFCQNYLVLLYFFLKFKNFPWVGIVSPTVYIWSER